MLLDPVDQIFAFELKHDRIAYWTSVGAQMSDIVAKLVKNAPAAAEPVAA